MMAAAKADQNPNDAGSICKARKLRPGALYRLAGPRRAAGNAAGWADPENVGDRRAPRPGADWKPPRQKHLTRDQLFFTRRDGPIPARARNAR